MLSALGRLVGIVVVLAACFYALAAAGAPVPTSLEELRQPGALQAMFESRVVTPSDAPLPGPAPVPAPHQHAPAAPSSDASDYKFISLDKAGRPARWNPCETIRYAVNSSQALPGALEDTHEAVRRLAGVTGLRFEYAGVTDRVPTSTSTKSSQAHILVAWAAPSQTDFLKPGASGNGGGVVVRVGSKKQFTAGSVVLNSEHNDRYTPGFGPGSTRGKLVMHELAHALGMGHSAAPGSLMYGTVGPSTPETFSAGDLAGLHRLGAHAGCM